MVGAARMNQLVLHDDREFMPPSTMDIIIRKQNVQDLSGGLIDLDGKKAGDIVNFKEIEAKIVRINADQEDTRYALEIIGVSIQKRKSEQEDS